MRKSFFILVSSSSLLLCSFFLNFHIKSTEAARVTGNCILTNVGVPPDDFSLPPECATLAEVPLYKQWDSRWGNNMYSDRLEGGNCDGQRIANSGCGVTSLAMVISYYTGREVLPSQTAILAMQHGWRTCGVGTDWEAMIEMPKLPQFGLTSKSISWDEAKRYLSMGIPIIQSQGPGYFTDGGHFIVITGILPNGNYAINDPDGKHRTESIEAQITASDKAQWVISRP